MATKKTAPKLESKVAEVITRSTLVKETESHIFKITNFDAGTPAAHRRLRGNITHKDGTRCGDFIINSGVRGMLSVNLNLNCKELLTDLLQMIDDIEAGNIVEVDEFNYVKAAKAAAEAAAEATETPVVEE